MVKFLVSSKTMESAAIFAREHNLKRNDVKHIPETGFYKRMKLDGLGGFKEEQLIGHFSDDERYFLTRQYNQDNLKD